MAQTENAPNKPVHLIYLCGAIVAFYLLQWSIDWIVGYFTKPPSEFTTTLISFGVTLVAAVVLYRNQRVHNAVVEISAELRKVTWPSAKEVRSATIVVMVMAVVSAFILGVFDFGWSAFTELIYG